MINLCGKWMFRERGASEYWEAEVPGSNYLDLMRLGVIEDPFKADYEKRDFWVAEKDWEYTRKFEYHGSGYAELVAEQLDTICEIYLNGELVKTGNNSHIFYRIDITKNLTCGENQITILFHSPMEYVRQKQALDPMPKNPNNEVTGIPHIRKAQCNFGWDWGPNLPLSGITGKIYIDTPAAKICNLSVRQKHVSGTVDLNIAGESEYFGHQDYQTRVLIFSPSGEEIQSFCSIERAWKFSLKIEDPQLWWTHEFSPKPEQPLYKVRAEILCGDRILCQQEKCIGLRTIELCRDRDQWGRDFCFVLNGVRIFAKGGDLIPADSFMTRQKKENIQACVEAVVRANMNMIRIWGGGYYGSDDLYDMCDRYGILIWQDFMFACEPYPFYDEEFLSSVKGEIECNVKRLRNHPSLALWCGNNEIETMSNLWKSFIRLREWTERFFYHILPEELEKYDCDTPYIAGTPNGDGYMSNISNDGYGDTHLWQVWHGFRDPEYYRTRYTRFCSEFGLESFPDLRTLREYIEEKDLSFHSNVMLVHQKCKNGNNKMLYYTASRFRIANDFEDAAALTQIIQSEGVRDASEHWRRNRGRCNGAVWWQLNDCWPVGSWSSIDCCGRYKALQYHARHFFAPQCISLQNEGNRVGIWLINDLNILLKGSLRVQVMDFSGSILTERQMDVSVNPLSAVEIIDSDTVWVKGKYKYRAFLVAQLLDESGVELSKKITLFVKENRAKLPKAKIVYKICSNDRGERILSLKSNTFARFVQIRQRSGVKPLEDNFFDLLPGEEIQLALPEDADEVSVKSLSDMTTRSSRLGDLLTRLAILIFPKYKA